MQGGGSPLQVDCIPENKSRVDQVQATGAVALLFKAALADFA